MLSKDGVYQLTSPDKTGTPWGVVVVEWSALSPCTPKIQVQILLVTNFLYCRPKRQKIKEKEARVSPFKKGLPLAYSQLMEPNCYSNKYFHAPKYRRKAAAIQKVSNVSDNFGNFLNRSVAKESTFVSRYDS